MYLQHLVGLYSDPSAFQTFGQTKTFRMKSTRYPCACRTSANLCFEHEHKHFTFYICCFVVTICLFELFVGVVLHFVYVLNAGVSCVSVSFQIFMFYLTFVRIYFFLIVIVSLIFINLYSNCKRNNINRHASTCYRLVFHWHSVQCSQKPIAFTGYLREVVAAFARIKCFKIHN